MSASNAPLPPQGAEITCIIPCLDEEEAIGAVVSSILSHGISEVIVVDGGSQDRTVERAKEAGARIVVEPRRGYGRAVQTGIAATNANTDIFLFLDGDGSDRTEFIPELIAPIIEERAVFVQGSRVRGEREPGSLSMQQIFAGHVAGMLLRIFYGAHFTDMSPYRVIDRVSLERLGMREETYGWNLEMLMRVSAARLPSLEIAVGQKRRIGGVSKVSGDFLTAVKAAWSIAMTFVSLAFALQRERKG